MKTMTSTVEVPSDHGRAIRTRLTAAAGDALMPTGTPVAHTLHDLFLAEVRQQGSDAAERAWMALDATAILEVGRAFQKIAWQPNSADYHLPAGTVVAGCMVGCAFVDWEEFGFDVDRPGLHGILDLPSRPGGSNLALLLRYIDELSRNLACRAIGMPTLVDRHSGRHPDHRLQFPPLVEAGGVILQRNVDFTSWGSFFCAFSDVMVRELAEEIVEDMRELWHRASSFMTQIRVARAAAEVAASRLSEVRVHAVTLELSPQLRNGDQVAIEFDAWDHAFRRGLVVQGFSSRHGRAKSFDCGPLDRATEVEALHALGADGRIGGIARAIVDAAPQGATAVLIELAEQFETFVTLATSTRPLHLRLHWRDGEVIAETRGGNGIDVSDKRVTLHRRTIPESVIDNLPGGPLRAVFDQPFTCGSSIALIENQDGNVVVTTDPDLWLVNCRTGRMWPDVRPPVL